MNNFSFLEKQFPVLEKLGSLAEGYLYSDPNSCLIKLGTMAENMVQAMFAMDKLPQPTYENTHANRIQVLKQEGLLPREIDDILYALRTTRNKAVHSAYDSFEDCCALLEMAHTLSVWFMQTYGNWNYEPDAFVLPKDTRSEYNFELLLKEKEALLAKVSSLEMAAANTAYVPEVSFHDRLKRSQKAASNIKMSEKETRYLIDGQLRKVGWEADTLNLRYSKGTRPKQGKNLAIAEWPTDSTISDRGAADYALFVGLILVGIIEAKRTLVDVSSVIDNQCRDYATNIKKEHASYLVATWDKYQVPFLFATNGRPYLKQLDTKSGIWFRDARSGSNIPRALQGWISPTGLMDLLERDIQAANASLASMSNDLLLDKSGLNLRPYQVKAIEAAERAITEGKQTALLAMATGTGKTRTILGMIYRFLKSGRFRRVLFLVDRNALGEQAQDVFKDVKLEDLLTIDDIYNIKKLEDKQIDKETRIQVATVQSMVKRILYNVGESMPSVTDYDLIVVDEAHRGYILDKEIGEDELLCRDQIDYVSKYRTVIEYFDAVKIALTATPALHTTEIFGKPVISYTYREAVIEGWLVDHDAPHMLKTRLNTDGIKYEKGETVVIYDPVTGQVINSEELEDELKFDVEVFNRQVITEPFNRTVLNEIARDIDPTEKDQGKTLIFAVNDDHADLITKILKEIYSETGVDNDAVMKITGSIGGGNRDKVLEAIKRFKNERFPSIVVTVDLLTTGIDVPEITTLVFMRKIKSRILFEQMMGRATRLCPDIHKTHFEIYDPVRVYEDLQDVSTMKPVTANPSATFTDLLNGLAVVTAEEKARYQIDLILAKLQRRKRVMTSDEMAQFIDLSHGHDPAQFMQALRTMTSEEARERLLNNRKLLEMLNEGGMDCRKPVVISDKPDELISHTRGYGDGQRPEDYLDSFAAFIKDNVNQIAALNIVCTRPLELTRESLESLRLALDREGFTVQQLNTAWRELKNEDIAADIISFIRRNAIGSVLLSHSQRIQSAVGKLLKQHSFTKQEENWIHRMEEYLLHESILNEQTFEEGAFKDNGGFARIDKVFRGNLRGIVKELNDYLYDDGGKTA